MVQNIYWEGLTIKEMVSELRRSNNPTAIPVYELEDKIALIAETLAKLLERFDMEGFDIRDGFHKTDLCGCGRPATTYHAAKPYCEDCI